jgi:Ni/Co efflux regulator RcnB
MRVITGTEEGGDIDPTSINVDNMVDRLIRYWYARRDRLKTETVCHAEGLYVLAGGNEEVTMQAMFLDFRPAYLHRPNKTVLQLQHFLTRDSHHNWAAIDTPERLIIGLRGLGHWFFFLLSWQKVTTPLLDELIEQRVFHMWSIRYFLQELYGALASIPERARGVRVLAEEIEDAPMEDLLRELSLLKVKMTQEGMDRMYSSLSTKAGGPGVDSLIGTAHASVVTAPIAAPAAVPVAHKAPAPLPISHQERNGRSRSRSRDRGRTGDRHRDDDRRGGDRGRDRDRDGVDRHNGGGRKQEYCLDDVQYTLRLSRDGCSYGNKCFKIHTRNIRMPQHSSASMEKQIHRDMNCDGAAAEGTLLIAALASNKASPFYKSGK